MASEESSELKVKFCHDSRVFFPVWIHIWIRIRNTDPDAQSCWIGKYESNLDPDPRRWLEAIWPVLWIRNDLFRIRIQLWIFRVPDPGKSFGSMRIRIQPLLFKYIWKM